jgi:hypothetical protein
VWGHAVNTLTSLSNFPPLFCWQTHDVDGVVVHKIEPIAGSIVRSRGRRIVRSVVLGVVLAFAMSGAALARHGGEGNNRGHESEHSQGEHHHHQLNGGHS